LIDRGAIVVVARGSDGAVYANAIISTLKWRSAQTAFDFNGWWEDVARAVCAQFRKPMAGRLQ